MQYSREKSIEEFLPIVTLSATMLKTKLYTCCNLYLEYAPMAWSCSASYAVVVAVVAGAVFVPRARRTSVSVAMADWHVVDLAPQSNAVATVGVLADQAPQSAGAIQKYRRVSQLIEINLRESHI